VAATLAGRPPRFSTHLRIVVVCRRQRYTHPKGIPQSIRSIPYDPLRAPDLAGAVAATLVSVVLVEERQLLPLECGRSRPTRFSSDSSGSASGFLKFVERD
jgi:hypothetical protein